MAARLVTNVELSLRCHKLKSMDLMSKSDPFAVIYTAIAIHPGAPLHWSEAGRTEVVLNNNSPDFSTHVKIPFHFEETQPVRIALFDWDGGKLPGMGSGSTMARATGHEKIDAATGQPTGQWEGAAADFLGCISTTLGRIMGSRGSTLVVPVHTTADGSADAASAAAAAAHSGGSSGGAGAAATVAAAPNGVLVVSGAEVKGDNDAIRITFSGKKLDAKDGFLMFGRTSDPYIAICSPLPADLKGTPWEATPYAAAATAAASSGSGGSSTSASTGRRQMWVGPVLKKTVDPVWPTCDLPIASICPGGDKGAPLMLECWDWDAGSAHDLIGVTGPVTVEQLASMSGSGTPMTLVNPKKKAKSGYTNSGELRVDNAFIYHVPTLLDYVTGGCQLSLMVAVDFTGSNGDPRDPRSLHFWNPDPRAPLNAYGQAIVSVGNILQEYDSDKRFPAYGFGGNVGGRTLHCFALNGNDAAPDVLGVQGLLQSYQMALSTTGLSGPTLFAPMIQRAIHTCRIGGGVTQERQHYTTLLLITDGGMNDADETLRLIVDASYEPLSIVIVGVGNADFGAMEMLDGDNGLLSYGGRPALRDVVQFVPFNKFASIPDGGARLAAEVLAEIPDQLVRFFASRGIGPNAPLAPVALDLPPPSAPPAVAMSAAAASGGVPATV